MRCVVIGVVVVATVASVLPVVWKLVLVVFPRLVVVPPTVVDVT